MVRVIAEPKRIQAHGKPPKVIEEFVGQASSGTSVASVARMVSPAGWSEPGQTPEFDEFTVVLQGLLRVETRNTVHEVAAGQAIIVNAGEWVRYSTPEPGGAQYIAVCIPAFSPDTVHRDRPGR
jgi:quercetin dioxygenase-like cupin family protein